MSVEDDSGESTTHYRGSGRAEAASTFETSCYERVMDCEAEIQSSALFRDAEIVDSPKEVTRATFFSSMQILEVILDYCQLSTRDAYGQPYLRSM